MRLVAVVLFVCAAAGLLVAGYLFSFCVPLESACHMDNAEACVVLARSLRTSAYVAALAMALSAMGFVARRTARSLDPWSAR